MKPTRNKHYGATGFKAFLAFWQNFANFKGRSTRGEYWWSTLFMTLIFMGLMLIGTIGFVVIGLQSPELFTHHWSFVELLPVFISLGLVVILLFIPNYAIAVRRFRDAGVHWGVFLGFQIVNLALSAPEILQTTGLMPNHLAQSWLLSAIGWGISLAMLVIEILPSKPLPDN